MKHDGKSKLPVSVIIPTFNRHAYLREAVDSVLAQTFTDYEVIVVDDGSTDGTGDVIRARYGDRVRYIRQENQGRSAARNNGAAAARGEYAAFLDDDDLWLPAKLEKMMAFVERGGFAFAGHRDDLLVDGRRLPNPKPYVTPLADGRVEFPRRSILAGSFFRTPTAVCRRDLFIESGGYPVEFSVAEDTLWMWRMAALAPAGFLAETLMLVRTHAGQEDRCSLGWLGQRMKVLQLMEESIRNDEEGLRAQMHQVMSRTMFVYASALAGAGRRREARAAALGAAGVSPGAGNFLRLAAWALGRDFRRPLDLRERIGLRRRR